LQGERAPALGEAITQLVSSLEDGHRDVLHRYHRGECPVARVAAQTGLAEVDVVRVLQAVGQDLRQALSARPATRVFLQPAAARAWGAFLADCLRWTWGGENYLFHPDRGRKYQELLRTHYGPAFDLLCPRGWN
jgi:hypothetical protein